VKRVATMSRRIEKRVINLYGGDESIVEEAGQ